MRPEGSSCTCIINKTVKMCIYEILSHVGHSLGLSLPRIATQDVIKSLVVLQPHGPVP